MDVSIIMPTYKRNGILKNTLDGYKHLESSSLSWCLTIVDNACEESTQNLVNQYSDSIPVRYISESKPGKNNALNSALPYATGELVVFTDDDAIPERDWLRNIVEGARRWPEHQLFGGKIHPKYPEGEHIDARIPLDHELVQAAYVIADWDQKEGPIGYGKIWGPNMIVRKCVLEAGLSFNPSIGPSPSKDYIMGDELEFLRNAHNLNFRSVYLPGAKVYHQIRPDQLTMKWLVERIYKDGRSRAFSSSVDKKAKKWFGIPRYLYRKFIQSLILSKAYWLSGKKRRCFEQTMAFYMAWGSISMHREIKRNGN